MTGMGHNKPPSLIEIAKTLTASWGMWMGDYPVVLDEVQARESKMELDRAKLLLKDLEDERKSKTAPLLDQVDTIRNEYRQPERTLGNVINEMMERLQAYVRAEEKKRERLRGWSRSDWMMPPRVRLALMWSRSLSKLTKPSMPMRGLRGRPLWPERMRGLKLAVASLEPWECEKERF